MIRLLLLQVLLLGFYQANSSNKPLVISELNKSYNITENTLIYCDQTGTADFTTISDSLHLPLFYSYHKRIINLGTSNHVYWFRFDVINQTNRDEWFLDIDYPVLNKVTVYMVNPMGAVDTVLHGGLDYEGTDEIVGKTSVLARLMLEKNNTYRVFMRVQTSSYLILPAQLRSVENYLQKSTKKNTFIFGFYGITIAILLVNIIIFIITREKTYLWLVLLLALLILSSLFQFGLGSVFLPEVNPWLRTRLRLILFGFAAIVFMNFAYSYLSLVNNRLMTRIYNGIGLFFMVYILVILLPFIPNNLLNQLNPFLLVVGVFSAAATAVYALYIKQQNAVYFILAISVFAISSITWLLVLKNIIQFNVFTYHINIVATAVFSVLLTFGLIEKINNSNREKQKMIDSEAANRLLSEKIEALTIAEKALTESEENFNLLFTLSPQPVIVSDYETGIYIAVNDKMCEFSGYSREQIIGKSSIDLKIIDVEFRQTLINVLKKNGELIGHEFSFQKQNGEMLNCLLNATVIRIKEDLRLIVTISDITGFKKSQAEIKKLFIAIEQSASSIIITNAHAEIEYVNPFFKQLTGYSLDDVIGKNPSILNSGFHTKDFYFELWNTILQGKIWKGEFLNRKKNGETYWEMATISPVFDEKGQLQHFVALKEDITHEKMQLETIQKSEIRLIEVNATKDKFFSIIGHDLMDPFNALLGFSDLLQDSLKNGEHEDSLEFASYIDISAKKVFNLLQNLLIWSKAQGGGLKPQPMVVNISELIADVISTANHSARIKEIEIQVDTDEKAKGWLDYNMIATVLRNLVGNSVKFTPKGGSIKLTAKIKDNNLVCSVTDSGIGMTETQLNNLFRLDKSASAKGTADEAGTGLGLIICKEFIDLQGGKISVESTLGKGSKFSISVPAGIG